ncbi:MAG: hypothetical protein PHC62_00295 [Candidatus Izemoplasmatales bacterium]|nr:hypothetical protein [Candidatus Izemoplasmatales bacterium]
MATQTSFGKIVITKIEDALKVSIETSSQFFKSSNGITYTPNEIVLTPSFTGKATFKNWQVSSDAGATWTTFGTIDGISIATVNGVPNCLKILNTSSIFNNTTKMVIFRVNINEDINIYDVMSIAKITDGTNGADGYNSQVLYLYKRSVSIPTIDWSGNLTFNFTNNTLSPIPSGWSREIPAENGQALYVTVATAYSTSLSDTIAKNEWSAPVLMNVGITGEEITYQQSSSGTIVPTNTWLLTIPAINPGEYLWTKTVIVYSDGKKSSPAYSVSQMGNTGISAKSVDISTSTQIFKSTDGGITFAPDTIVLNPIFQGGISYNMWQYSIDGGSTWVNITSNNTGGTGNMMIASGVLTVKKECDLFTNIITSISLKCISNDTNISDTITIVKLYDVTDIQIGGRNLVINSTGNLGSTIKWTNAPNLNSVSVVTGGGVNGNNSIKLVSPSSASARAYVSQPIISRMNLSTISYMTLGFWYKASTDNDIYGVGMFLRITNSAMYDTLNTTSKLVVDNQWHYATITQDLSQFRNDSDVISASLFIFAYKGTVEYSCIKLETGNKNTDWTPAPEDIDQGIADVAIHQILLSNENQSITTNSNGATTSKIDVKSDITCYKGTTQVAGIIGTLTCKDANGNTISTGISLAKTNPTASVSGTVTFTINSGTNLATDYGSVVIPITVEGKTYTKLLSWSKSKTGLTGDTGVGVSGSEIKYQKSSSGTTPPTGTWSDSPVAPDLGGYVWVRTTTFYTNGTESVAYNVSRSGSNGSVGQNGLNVATVQLFKRVSTDISNHNTTSNPSTFPDVVVYYFNDVGANKAGSVIGTTNGWTTTIPSGSDPVYTITTTAAVQYPTNSVSIPRASWSDVIRYAENGSMILLSNECQTFEADMDGKAFATTFDSFVYGYIGTTLADVEIGSITKPTGMTITVNQTKTATYSAKLTFSISNAFVSPTGSINIPIKIVNNGVETIKQFSYSLSKKGDKGDAGVDSKLVTINSSTQVFKSIDGGITFTPNTIVLTPNFQGGISYSSWQYSINGGSTWVNISSNSTGGTGNMMIASSVLTIKKECNLFTTDLTTLSLKCISNNSSYFDIVTIMKLYDVTDIAIGGVNLLRDSDFNVLNTSFWRTRGTNMYTLSIDSIETYNGRNSLKIVSTVAGSEGNDMMIGTTVTASAGEKYILSFYAKSSVATVFRIRWGFVSSTLRAALDLTTSWTRYEVILATTGMSQAHNFLYAISDNAGTIYLNSPKIERGNKATDYTIAPEDLDKRVTDIKVDADATKGRLGLIIANNSTTSSIIMKPAFIETLTPQMVYKSPNDDTKTIIEGGKFKTHAITADMIATDALKSLNYQPPIGDSVFSTVGSYYELSTGTFQTPYFAVNNTGAYIDATVTMRSGKIGDLLTSYWQVETATDRNAVSYASIRAVGNAMISTGKLQLTGDKLSSYNYGNYILRGSNNRFYDFGLKVPDVNAEDTSIPASVRNKFLYVRRSNSSTIPSAEVDWIYDFAVDVNDGIMENGVWLKDKYASIDGVNGTYLPLTGGTISGSLTVQGDLNANASYAKQLLNSITINNKAFNGLESINVGTIGVGYGGTGKTSWTQYGIVYASASGTLAQLPVGTNNHVLIGKGSAAPAWIAQSDLSVGIATKAIQDEDGNPIKTMYFKNTGGTVVGATTFETSVNIDDLTSGNLLVQGSARFVNGLIGNIDGLATKATQDASGNIITDTYIKGLSISGKTITYTRGNNTTGTIVTQDTTYEAAGANLGLIKTGGNVNVSGGIITVPDNSHNHTIANVTNLQTTLDGKSPLAGSQSLTQLAQTITLGEGNAATILQNMGNIQQKIEIIDTSTVGDRVFTFSRSVNSGTSFSTLMEIRNDGVVSASNFLGNLIGNADTATKATQDSAGQQINTTYVKELNWVSSKLQYTKGNGSNETVTIPNATSSSVGLVKASPSISVDPDGLMNVNDDGHYHNTTTIKPLIEKTYTGIYASVSDFNNATFYFGAVKPTNWETPWHVKYRILSSIPGQPNYSGMFIVDFYGNQATRVAYSCWNNHTNTSNLSLYYHVLYSTTSTGVTNGYGHPVGIGLRNSTNPTNSAYARIFKIEILEIDNCSFDSFDTMKLYSEIPGSGSTNYSGYTEYEGYVNGLKESGDDNTYDRLILSNNRLIVGGSGVVGTSLIMEDANNQWQSLVTTRSTGTTKIKNTIGFHPQRIYYYNSGTNVASGDMTATYTVYNSYVGIDFRYNSNCGSTLVAWKPVYLKGAMNNGLFYLADVWYSQELPTTDDGFVYIYIGDAYSTTACNFNSTNPIYWYKNGYVRMYPETGVSVTEDYVPSVRAIAGIDLVDNIASTELVNALKGTSATTLSIGNHEHGYTSSIQFGTTSDIYVSSNKITVPKVTLIDAIGLPTADSYGLFTQAEKDKLASVDVGKIGISSVAGTSPIVTSTDSNGKATIAHSNSGVIAGEYGATITADEFEIPSFIVSATGHITATNKVAISAANLVNRLGTTPVNRATADASGNVITTYYARVNGANATGTWGIGISGNAATATKWETASTITLTGAVTGNVSIDGSGNVSLATTVNHTHNYVSTLALAGVNFNAASNVITVTRANLVTAIGVGNTTETTPVAIGLMTEAERNKLANINISDIGVIGANTINGDAPINVVITQQGIANISHNNSGVSVGAYGATPTNYFRIPNITVDARGHVTAATYNDITADNLVSRLDITPVNRATADASGNAITTYYARATGTNATGTWDISITGNSATATKWATARTITLTGAVTGSVSMDGTGNVSLATTLTTHTHNYLSTLTLAGVNFDVASNVIAITQDNLITAIGTTGTGLISSTERSKLAGIDVGKIGISSVEGTAPISTSTDTNGKATITHNNSGVTANSYGPNSEYFFRIPNITVDARGHITSATYYDITSANIVSRLGATPVNRAIADASGNYIENTYLKLAGGEMTGPITLNGLYAKSLSNITTDFDTVADGIYHTYTDSNTSSRITNAPINKSQVLLSFMPYSSGSTIYRTQMVIDSEANMFLRGSRDNNTWRTILTSKNYAAYTVTKTGTGASGTWGIDISGNAATASSAVNATSAGKATNDSDGNPINTTYLKRTGGTVTGTTTFDTLVATTGTITNLTVSGTLNATSDKASKDALGNVIDTTYTKRDGSNATGTWGINTSGNSATTTKFATTRTIAISGGATGTATGFDGTSNISIPITSLDAAKLSGIATINTTGSAAKWTTPRTVTIGGGFTGNFSIDGSQNVNFELFNYYACAVVNNTNNYPFHRIAKIDLVTAAYRDYSTTLYISRDYQGGYFGIVRIALRTNGAGQLSAVEAKWLVCSGFDKSDLQMACYNVNGETYVDVFLKTIGGYTGAVIRDIGSGKRSNIVGRAWDLVDSNENNNTTSTDKLSSYECWASIEDAGMELHGQPYSVIQESTEAGKVNNANTATDATNVIGGTVTASTLTVNNTSQLKGAVTITGATTLNSTLNVTGLSTFTGKTTHNGGLQSTIGQFTSTLDVTGITTLNNTLNVTGLSTFTGKTVHNNGIEAKYVDAYDYISANPATASSSGGLALWGRNPLNNGITMRMNTELGTHGYINHTHAIYMISGTSHATNNMGWIFRSSNKDMNIASISDKGDAQFDGKVKIGGNSGVELVYNEITKSLDFVFA